MPSDEEADTESRIAQLERAVLELQGAVAGLLADKIARETYEDEMRERYG
jgi:hypothetical protein